MASKPTPPPAVKPARKASPKPNPPRVARPGGKDSSKTKPLRAVKAGEKPSSKPTPSPRVRPPRKAPSKPNPLRAVKPGEKASPKRNMSVFEAAESGDRLEELRAMRRRIAKTLDEPNTPARDLAALSRRQIELGKEIDVLEARAKEESSRAAVADEAFDAEAI